MTDHKLTADDARVLLGEHIDGGLEPGVRAEIDALLASDAALATEHRRLKETLSLLKTLPPPDAPADMVGKVRDRLAAERRASLDAPQRVDNVVRPARRRWGGLEAGIGLAAAAGIAVFIAVAGPAKDAAKTGEASADGTAAAGIAGDEPAVAVTITAADLAPAIVDEAARKAGMVEVSDGVYQGERREAARFLLALKTAAAERGLEISGFVPDAARVRVEVKGREGSDVR
jgi:anti-sigma factor RsiW